MGSKKRSKVAPRRARSPEPQVRVEYVPLEKFKSADINPKEHDEAGIQASFERFGFKDFPTINEATGKLVEGHGRVAALSRMKQAGSDPPEGVVVRGDEWLVPTVRGLKFKTKQLAEEYIVAHNQLTIAGGFDTDVLGKLMKSWSGIDVPELGLSLGFDNEQLMKHQQFNEWVTALGKAEVARLAGKKFTEADVSLLLNGDADVYKPNGEPLVLLRRGAVAVPLMDQAYEALHSIRDKYKTDNRGNYTGAGRASTVIGGVTSKSNRTRDGAGKIINVMSAIVGYYDRQGGRHPYCRTTAFTSKEVKAWGTVLPMVRQVSDTFGRELPDRYRKQCQVASNTNPTWVIEGTPFTTLTVNNNVVAATHKDKGDYKDGFGIISVIRRGEYRGCWLFFPEYGVAADLQHGDVLFFNSHDWHCNTPFHHTEEGYERISVVYYFREKMVNCGTLAQELEHAKKTRGGL